VRWPPVLLALLMTIPMLPATAAPAESNIVIVEGEGAANRIRQRTAREPIVQVEDENHKPVAGAVVVFALPAHDAGGAFANGAHNLTAVTNDQGRATARGFQANGAEGSYQMRVNASGNGQAATASINMVNAAVKAGGGNNGNNGTNGTIGSTSASITPGAGTAGPPR
jgi:hypothetical protein